MKYKVTVVRTCHQTLEIEVDADSTAGARDKAIEMAPNLDFSGKEKEADYEVEAIEKK